VSRRQPGDPADRALGQLVTELREVVADLEQARTRAQELQAQRAEGRSWHEIVSGEERPLIVEQVTSALSALADAGGQWRRTQAQALHDESVSINRIAELYGVSRQRVSALLRGREDGARRDD
jgi:predicted transcriptional regulator